MLRILVLSVFLTSYTLLGQTNQDQMYSVAYLAKTKLYHSSVTPFQEYFNLKIKGNTSNFQTYKGRQLDSLRQRTSDISDNDFTSFYSHNRYVIITQDNKLTHNEFLFEDEYVYHETLDLDWTLYEQTKIIKGYNCKKATVSYGGRFWTAWYTTEIPLNAGPYKFKGLPGLIMKVTDYTNSYDFEFYDMAVREAAPINDRYYHLKPKDQRIILDRNTFNATKHRFEAMSLSEQLSMSQQFRGKGGQVKVIRVDSEDNVELREPRNRNRAEDNNLIEIDHK